jgi:putative membrane protein
LYVIGKTRSGAMDAVNRIFERSLWDENVLIVFLVSILFVSILSYFSTISIGKRASILLPRLNYKIFSASILILIVAMVIVLAGLFGLIVFLCAIPIGLIPTFAGIRRTHAMGVLLLPLILRFL